MLAVQAVEKKISRNYKHLLNKAKYVHFKISVLQCSSFGMILPNNLHLPHKVFCCTGLKFSSTEVKACYSQQQQQFYNIFNGNVNTMKLESNQNIRQHSQTIHSETEQNIC
jgi:hypothetical protein